ncbi:MAG: pitrilysin family protein [Eubacteriales bacterium]|nr:pitrilysin family protein [Eubacteriales bacterium]
MIFNKVYYENIDETLYSAVHESGLKVYLLPKDFTKTYAVIGTRFGSANDRFILDGKEVAVPDGIAHFLEHKLFEKKDGTNAFDDYARTGASANAYTGFSNTCYLFSCTDNLKENLEILLSFVAEPYFTDENVEKEQGIITQEIRMYDDDPNWSVYFSVLKCMYSDFPIRKDIAGTAESIREITPEYLYTCYNSFYNPKNMILFIVGDVGDFDSISEIVDKYVKNTNDEVPKSVFPTEPQAVFRDYYEQSMSVPTPLFMIGFKERENTQQGRELLRKQIATEILLEMVFDKSSDLYHKLYNDGLINDSFSSEFACENMYAHTVLGGESPDPCKVRDEIAEYIKSVKLSKDDFIRCQRAYLGDFLHGLNSIDGIGHEFISSMFTDVNYLETAAVCEEITFEEIEKRFSEHFIVEQMALSVVRPIEK